MPKKTSYMRFEKANMVNLEESLPRELIRTNRSGAYSYTTIVDCNTRKYHGLLTVPMPNMDGENHVLLSMLDVSVVQHDAEFNLGLHQYDNGIFSPKGHKYIRSFDCDKVPTTYYQVGSALLKKEVVFEHYSDRLLIRYTLEETHSPQTLLRLRPYLAFRSVRAFTHANGAANTDYTPIAGGIKMRLYDGYPYLCMQISKRNTYVHQPDWYRNTIYIRELERGYDAREDLLVPGYFEVNIRQGESIVFAASTQPYPSRSLLALAAEEIDERKPRDSFFHCLVNAAHQFHNRKPNDERYLIAGYPWYKTRARDTFIALPGLTLAIGETDYFQLVMHTAQRALRQFINGKPTDPNIEEIEHPDVPLWCIWAIQQYTKQEGWDDMREQGYDKLIKDLMRYITANKHPNLRLMTNGLVWTDGKQQPATWMNSILYGKPVNPRTGYVVEINALWYNALCFAVEILKESAPQQAKQINAIAAKCKESFCKTFCNAYGYLYDYVEEGTEQDLSVRPNMIFAVALDHSPLNREWQKKVLDICTRELLTPKGLRTLSPKSEGYRGKCIGTRDERDYAFHQGTAWPWLGGFYMEACLKFYKMSRLSFVQRQMAGYENDMFNQCISIISEFFDGNPPYQGRGAMSFAINVAEVLRTLQILEDSNEHPQTGKEETAR